MRQILKFLQRRKIFFIIILSMLGLIGGSGFSLIDLLAQFTWLFYAAVIMIGILPIRKNHTYVSRLRLLFLGSIISAVCMTQVQVAVDKLGDIWGIFLITVGITIIIIFVQSLIKTKQFPAMAIGAIIYLLSLSISFAPITAYFATVAIIFFSCSSVALARQLDKRIARSLV